MVQESIASSVRREEEDRRHGLTWAEHGRTKKARTMSFWMRKHARSGRWPRGTLAIGCAALLGGGLALPTVPTLLSASPNRNVALTVALKDSDTPTPAFSLPPAVGHASAIGPMMPGYVQHEFFVSGNAHYYTSASPLTSDGMWTTTPSATTAPYKIRILVNEPIDPSRFNGTVMVEWFNVSGGADGSPEWIWERDEIARTGDAWVGVDAQWAGVDGPQGLVATDPARYGTLSHPGDAYSYDIFSQVGKLLRSKDGPLGDAYNVKILIADGHSQSASRLATYVNAVQYHANVYDGFLIHSRGSGGAPLSQTLNGTAGTGTAVNAPPNVATPNPEMIRTDTGAKIIAVQSEYDVGIDGFGGYLARQPDNSSYRLWEITGTSHVDAYGYFTSSGENPFALVQNVCGTPEETTVPINNGPMTFAMRTAVHWLQAWISQGEAPPVGDRIDTVNGVIQRDPATRIAIGGIRYPDITVPTETLIGDRGAASGGFCAALYGAASPWDGGADPWDGTAADPAPYPAPVLSQLYPTHTDYVNKVIQATDQMVDAGFLLRQDAHIFTDAAWQSLVPDCCS